MCSDVKFLTNCNISLLYPSRHLQPQVHSALKEHRAPPTHSNTSHPPLSMTGPALLGNAQQRRTPSSWGTDHLLLKVEIHGAETELVLSSLRSGLNLRSTSPPSGNCASCVTATGDSATKNVECYEKLLSGKVTHFAVAAVAGLLVIWWLWELGPLGMVLGDRAAVVAVVIAALCGLAVLAVQIWKRLNLSKVPAARFATIPPAFKFPMCAIVDCYAR